MKYYVYELWDVVKNQPLYVGKGCGKRTAAHTSKSHLAKQDGNQFKKNVIRKMLSENNKPVVKYVFRSDNEISAYNEETRLILQYGRRDLGTGILTNLTNGGIGSLSPSIESRYKMGSPNRGRQFSEETKIKMSLSAKSRDAISEETRLKMSTSKVGKVPACIETRRSYNGEGNPQFGKIWSEEKRNKMSETNKGRKRVHRDGTFYYVYPHLENKAAK